MDLLRDNNLETYWQSDGSQPHLVDISTWLKKTHEDDEDALASPPEKA